jgi:hypothetical protein
MRLSVTALQTQGENQMLGVLLALATSATLAGVPAGIEPFLGNWSTTITDAEGTFLSGQIDVEKRYGTIYAGLVWRWASYGPIEKVAVEDGVLKLERGDGDRIDRFSMRVVDGGLQGEVVYPDGSKHHFEGRRTAKLGGGGEPEWGEPIALFDGNSLAGWRLRDPKAKMGWAVVDGELAVVEPKGNADLVSEKSFQDMKLHLEFNLEPHSNSGAYLRGRYEVQIIDSPAMTRDPHGAGGVYSRIAPCRDATGAPGQWQTLDITFVGRQIAVVLNGQEILTGRVPGITGGALDPWEDQPGPLMLQGDHGKVRFRNITVTPAR